MARYERDTQFCEIERDGATVTIREGAVGADPTEISETYVSPLAARHHVNEYVRPLVIAGYRHIDPPPRHADIPDDDGARLVHGDILQLRGDPHGELIVMHARGVDGDALVEANASECFGDLAVGWPYLGISWRLGWIRGVRLTPFTVLQSLLPEIMPWQRIPLILEALFELPLARALEEVVLEQLVHPNVPAAISAIVSAPPTLHTLEIDGVLDLGSLQKLHRAPWPRLRRLAFALDAEADAALLPILHRRCLPALAELVISTQEPTRLARLIAMTDADHAVVIRSEVPIDPTVLQPNIRYERI